MVADRPRRLGSRRLGIVALATAALVAIAGGCGEKSEETGDASAEQIDLALDWFPNPDHVGIYTALARNYFEDAGFDVQPQVPSDPSAPIKQVAAGRADLAISYEPEVILARDQGLPVIAVAALVPEPLTSLVSLGNKVPRPTDLKGKRVATAGIPYQTAYLEAILEQARLTPDDVSQVDIGLNLISPLLAGKVDAVLGMFWNVEGIELARRGERPDVEPVDELGIPTYDELVLVANEDELEEDAESIRLFIAALERGTESAVAHPRAATQALLRANDDLDPGLTRAQVRATLPALAGRGGLSRRPEDGKPYGYMNPNEWEEFAGFLLDEGLIDVQPEVDELLTNEFLPGEIPD